MPFADKIRAVNWENLFPGETLIDPLRVLTNGKLDMFRTILRSIRNVRASQRLPEIAKKEREIDDLGLPDVDHAIIEMIRESIEWIGRAQDNSASRDGGVARDFSLLTGWNASYPETTGYIIPTLLTYAKINNDETVRSRAKRMLDWLVSIQFPDGGFQGSVIGAVPQIPVTFNTGQILLGLASGTEEFGDEYREPMRRAADWLVRTQDSDGCWRKHRSPFANQSDKAYETHVSWGLFEAARLEPESNYAEAAIANIKWALSLQTANGWFENCCLSEPEQPLTHTLGYVLRGVIEAYRFTDNKVFLEASLKTADSLVTALRDDGFLPGRLDSNWRGTVSWSCLTGNVQIAACWLLLFEYTGEIKYRDAAFAANKFVRRTIRLDGKPEIRGAVKGSFPVTGDYCAYEYPNWASKFFIDSHIMEQALSAEGPI
jgi:hypothetical protein